MNLLPYGFCRLKYERWEKPGQSAIKSKIFLGMVAAVRQSTMPLQSEGKSSGTYSCEVAIKAGDSKHTFTSSIIVAAGDETVISSD